MTDIDDVTALATQFGDERYAKGRSDQSEVDGPVIQGLETEVADLQAELEALQPTIITEFGFNCPFGTSAYSGVKETAAQINARLVKDYGPFTQGKTFPGTVVPSISQTSWPAYPSVKGMTECFAWTIGDVAKGVHDAAFTSLSRSVAKDNTLRITWNEVDYDIIDRGLDPVAYVKDMDHLYDLLTGLTGLQGKVELWDCFGEFHLKEGTFKNSFTNPSKRHGIVWDWYENHAGVDDDGALALARIVAAMKSLGMKRYGIGEHGDRKPGSGVGSWPNDALRAAALTARMNNVKNLSLPPEFFTYFNVEGKTGKHQFSLPPFGTDFLAAQAYKDCVTG